MSSLLDVQSITKRFPRRRTWGETLRRPLAGDHVVALREVSFSVAEGEFFGLLGANGAGKTTLMKVIATLMLPDGGCVTVDGADAVNEAATVRSRVALSLAAERGLYWRLSGRENLRLFAELQLVPRHERDARIDDALAAVGLAADSPRLASEYSSGMVQRLLIARALLVRPRVLLLDEPTRSLDPIGAREFRVFLRKELASRGCAVVLATHNADEAFDLCDRVAVMERGRVLATGRARDLAAAIGERRYQLMLAPAGLEVLRDLEGAGAVTDVRDEGRESREAAFHRVHVTIPGDDASAARVLAALVHRGVEVPSFARQATTLADLLQQVLRGQEAPAVEPAA